jgi:hypothetical protein
VTRSTLTYTLIATQVTGNGKRIFSTHGQGYKLN